MPRNETKSGENYSRCDEMEVLFGVCDHIQRFGVYVVVVVLVWGWRK